MIRRTKSISRLGDGKCLHLFQDAPWDWPEEVSGRARILFDGLSDMNGCSIFGLPGGDACYHELAFYDPVGAILEEDIEDHNVDPYAQLRGFARGPRSAHLKLYEGGNKADYTASADILYSWHLNKNWV